MGGVASGSVAACMSGRWCGVGEGRRKGEGQGRSRMQAGGGEGKGKAQGPASVSVAGTMKKAGRAQRLVRSPRVGVEEAGKGVRRRRDGRGGIGQRETTTFLVPVLGRGGLATKLHPAKGEILAKVQLKIGES